MAFIKTYCHQNVYNMPPLCIEVNGNSYNKSNAGPTLLLVVWHFYWFIYCGGITKIKIHLCAASPYQNKNDAPKAVLPAV